MFQILNFSETISVKSFSYMKTNSWMRERCEEISFTLRWLFKLLYLLSFSSNLFHYKLKKKIIM